MLDISVTDEAFSEIASRSRGTPHHEQAAATSPRLGAGETGAARGSGAASEALNTYEVDELGLDRLDRAVLHALCRTFRGGPVGLSTLAVIVGEETETVETVAEPYLVREGLLARTPRGRVATEAAWRHLGLTPPGAERASAGPAARHHVVNLTVQGALRV